METIPGVDVEGLWSCRMAVLKPVVEHLWQVRVEASFRTVPPLELMHLAAAANTVVRDKYGL